MPPDPTPTPEAGVPWLADAAAQPGGTVTMPYGNRTEPTPEAAGARLESRLDAIQAVHQPLLKAPKRAPQVCRSCGEMWPCDTAVVIAELADYQATFDLTHAATMRGIAMWREGHPERELRQPATDTFVCWLLAEVARLTAERDALAPVLAELHRYVGMQEHGGYGLRNALQFDRLAAALHDYDAALAGPHAAATGDPTPGAGG